MSNRLIRHRRLTSLGRRALSREDLVVVDPHEGDFPAACNVDRVAHALFTKGIPSWRHSYATGGGVIVGKGSVRAHEDGTPGWCVFTLCWMKEEGSATLQVGNEWQRLEPGTVLAFKASFIHSWVCHSPWTAVFMDLEQEIRA